MIRLLDCTLRDGGYLNDWEFGKNIIRYMVERQILSGEDVIEVGFLDERRPADLNRSIQPDTGCYDRLLEGIDKKGAQLFGMIDYGTCSIEHVLPRTNDSILDGIRVIFKKPNKEKAVAFARLIQERGYLVTLQMVSITAYQDRDVLDFCDQVNGIVPYAVGIVDTYGLMHQEQLMHYFDLLNHNLKPEIILGYHAHNNFQLAYSNSIRYLQSRTDRDLLVDGTAFGMGKSAGNAPVELLMMHLNDHYGKHYDINQVLEIIDVYVGRMKGKTLWGYTPTFFLSASNSCHPNYVTYLQSKKTLSMSGINELLHCIPAENRLDYNKAIIEDLYAQEQKRARNVTYNDGELKTVLEGKTILLLGPGKTLTDYRERIQGFMDKVQPTVISVNCVPQDYNPSFVFISNTKRYGLLHYLIHEDKSIQLIVTSNVGTISPADYVLEMSRYWEGDSLCADNALALLLNIMKQIGPKKLYLAGFDGFSSDGSQNFYKQDLAMADDFERLQSVNEELKKRITKARETLDIEIITPSRYE